VDPPRRLPLHAAPGSPRYVGKDVVRYFWPEACDQPHAGENAIAPTEWDSDYAELLQMKAELAEIKREWR
jgi:hypothetical protein